MPPPLARFCPQCGQNLGSDIGPALRSEAARDETEKRQLTVVFCDLVGSSELATSIDPEDFAALIGRFHTCVSTIMRRFDGFLAQPLGDGALFLFGYPQTNEDDTERAIRAGLATIEAVTAITDQDGRRLHVRVGIATGIAVVDNTADIDGARRPNVSGEAPNLAARLQALAAPDTVLVADNVRRLAGELFVYRDLGMQTLKGWKSPVPVAEVMRPAANPSRFDARTGRRLTPLIGRAPEAERLLALWRTARNGAGRVALVTGEPGIGKSRLVAQLIAETKLDAPTRLRWFCVAHQQGTALHPCVQQFEFASGIAPEDPPEVREAKLKPLLEGASPEDLVLLANLLMLPFDRRSPVLQASLQQRRERTLRALLNVQTRLCARRPILALFEDAHWSDPTSAEYVDLLVRHMASLPILLVVTARPEFKPDWINADVVEHIVLQPLRPDEGAALVRNVAGPDALAKGVVEAIVSRCDGVPLFLEEITTSVLEEAKRRDGQAQASCLRGSAPAVPLTIHASLMARLDRLGPARHIAEAAAAIGRDFSIDLLRYVHQGADHVLDAAISRLIEAGLVVPSGPTGEGSFRFKHALIQDTAYGMMLRSRRRALHERIAAALEVHFPQTAAAEPQLLAHHYTEAGLAEQAVGWWLRAGTQSLQRTATAEALAQLRHGLELCSSLPDTEARRRQELDLQMLLAKAIMATEGHAAPACRAAVARIRELCTGLEAPVQLLSVLFGEWRISLLRAEFATARRQTDELLSEANKRNDPMWELLASYAAGFTYFCLGSFARANRFLTRGIALFEPDRREQYASVTIAHPDVMLHAYLAWERACVGRIEEAWAASDTSVKEARALGHYYTLAQALARLAHMQADIGMPADGLATADELLALAREHDIAFCEAVATFCRGCCLGRLGQEDDGLALMRRGLQLYHMSGTRLQSQMSLRIEAELLGQIGNVAEGLVKMDEAWDAVAKSGEGWDLAELHRTRGELLAKARNLEAAEIALNKAHAVARSQGALLFALRARVSLAALLADQGRRSEAVPALSEAIAPFASERATPDVVRAQQLLTALQ
ncbi:MAG TPA: adenylate/guanylate cyclase domain-containing protein [Acetobacteraceae bacterium]|nr:adenylate/guanylate cyclase domain-containing protein [Acetobacteraceae bacterium]